VCSGMITSSVMKNSWLFLPGRTKGGRREAHAIHPKTGRSGYALISMRPGHGGDLEGLLFRPLSHNHKRQETRRAMDPDAIDRVLRKHATTLGLGRGYSAHSMRATFITTALENGCSLERAARGRLP
jgi:integrase/recombinase XerD